MAYVAAGQNNMGSPLSATGILSKSESAAWGQQSIVFDAEPERNESLGRVARWGRCFSKSANSGLDEHEHTLLDS